METSLAITISKFTLEEVIDFIKKHEGNEIEYYGKSGFGLADRNYYSPDDCEENGSFIWDTKYLRTINNNVVITIANNYQIILKTLTVHI